MSVNNKLKDMESLKGHFLLSTPSMPDPRFKEQIVYLCSHDQEGAMGFVINNIHPGITFADIAFNAGLTVTEQDFGSIYIGGPVDNESGFILYQDKEGKYPGLRIEDDIHLSRDMKLVEDIAVGKGPENYLFLLGYAGWQPGQLETELMHNGWLTLPGDKEIIFSTPANKRWQRAAANHGIDISTFNDMAGNA